MFAVIFDLDGVLVDSISTIRHIMPLVAKDLGITLTKQETLDACQIPIHVQVPCWNARRGTTIDVADVTERYLRREKEYMRHHSILTEGVLPLLNELKKNDVRLGLATSAPRVRLKQVLAIAKIESYFDALVCVDDVQNPKPHPDPYLKAAKLLGINPSQCVGIEDTGTGINSVLSAGMKAVGFAPDAEMKKEVARANLIVERFDQLSFGKLSALFD